VPTLRPCCVRNPTADDEAAVYIDPRRIKGLYALVTYMTSDAFALRSHLEGVEASLAASAERTTLGLPIAVEDPEKMWRRLSVERRRAVVDALMTVTSLSWDSTRWSRTFHPELVRIEARH
jgi:hypothetical protein